MKGPTMSFHAPTGKTAILIVNGGDSTESNRWIQLCLEQIAAHTEYPNYHIYVWNNRIADKALEDWLLTWPQLTLLSAAGYERLNHPHSTPLQRLYHLARQEGAEYIVTMDSDAHPLRSDWLIKLLSSLEDGAAIAGVWRNEMVPAIRPHIHPSCLCTTVGFIEQHRLRFDFDCTHSKERTDTLSHFTWIAEANGFSIHRLLRSNQRNFHHWMGGIYGDLIYHHVAASREGVVFHSNPYKGLGQSDENRQLRDKTAKLLFNHYDQYIRWLRGQEVESYFEAQMLQLLDETKQGGQIGWWMDRLRSAYFRAGVHERAKRKVIDGLTKYKPLSNAVKLLTKLKRIPLIRQKVDLDLPIVCNAMHHAFKYGNLAPLASNGWVLKPPDWVGIGSPKSGTTWWHKLLTEHPQIITHRVRLANPYNKETQYFLHHQYAKMTTETITLYHEAFASPPGAICGEFSTQYLGYPMCLEHLSIAAPDAKIIAILRNPIDRFISHHNHLMTKRGRWLLGNLNQSQRYIFNTYSFYTEAMLHSLYSIGLIRLFQYYGRDRVLILQYERLVQSPIEELSRTYLFLGVDERFRAGDYQKQINAGTYIIAKPNIDERRRLAAYFKEDVQRVFALCPELDSNLWPDFIASHAKE
jgi:hypothetical protein